jgi:hypothetical protein
MTVDLLVSFLLLSSYYLFACDFIDFCGIGRWRHKQAQTMRTLISGRLLMCVSGSLDLDALDGAAYSGGFYFLSEYIGYTFARINLCT